MQVASRGARHFLYLPDRDGADVVAATLERHGWETAVHEAEDVCLVVATCLRVLAEPLASETHSQLESLAAQHGGSYDGAG